MMEGYLRGRLSRRGLDAGHIAQLLAYIVQLGSASEGHSAAAQMGAVRVAAQPGSRHRAECGSSPEGLCVLVSCAADTKTPSNTCPPAPSCTPLSTECACASGRWTNGTQSMLSRRARWTACSCRPYQPFWLQCYERAAWCTGGASSMICRASLGVFGGVPVDGWGASQPQP